MTSVMFVAWLIYVSHALQQPLLCHGSCFQDKYSKSGMDTLCIQCFSHEFGYSISLTHFQTFFNFFKKILLSNCRPIYCGCSLTKGEIFKVNLSQDRNWLMHQR